MADIFKRMKAGELILDSDPEYPRLYEALLRGMRITGELNSSYRTPAEVRAALSELTGQQLDDSVWVVPPFHTDFGQFIRFGRGVFVNNGCTFMDRGGITLDEFQRYFREAPIARALRVENPIAYPEPIDPRAEIPGFRPPQNFCYIYADPEWARAEEPLIDNQ